MNIKFDLKSNKKIFIFFYINRLVRIQMIKLLNSNLLFLHRFLEWFGLMSNPIPLLDADGLQILMTIAISYHHWSMVYQMQAIMWEYIQAIINGMVYLETQIIVLTSLIIK